MINAIDFVLDEGATNTAAGIDTARKEMFTAVNGDRVGDSNYMVVVTDGHSNIFTHRTLPAADDARTADIAVLAVGIGENGSVDRSEVNGIANDPDNQYAFMLSNAGEVELVANLILDLFCQ